MTRSTLTLSDKELEVLRSIAVRMAEQCAMMEVAIRILIDRTDEARAADAMVAQGIADLNRMFGQGAAE